MHNSFILFCALNAVKGMVIKMKILFTATVQSHICQFHLPFIEMLKKQGHEVHVAAKNNLDLKPGLKLDIADKVYDVPFERSPFSTQNIKAYKVLKKIMEENQYGMVHCNTPMGGVVTRLAANRKKTKVVYTAHGFHFFKGAPLKNWLMYYPMEWVLAFKTDVLICINKEDFALAKKHMHAKRVEYVHGVGVNERKIAPSAVSREEKRSELKIPENAKVLFSIGELNENKNHEVIIKAVAKINNPDIHYMIAGNGDKEEYLNRLSASLGIQDKVHLLGYKTDINELLQCSDVFCLPSKREGLSVALMEAAAAGLPVVCSDIRGNSDIIADCEGGYLCKPTDVDAFAEKISLLIGAEELCAKMSDTNKNNIKSFVLSSVSEEMRQIYFEQMADPFKKNLIESSCLNNE